VEKEQFENKRGNGIGNYSVGDRIYFEDYQSQYFNAKFYEKYSEAMENLRICDGFYAHFAPCSLTANSDEIERNQLISCTLKELKSLPYPPSEMIIDEDGVKCIWWLPFPINSDWFNNDEEEALFCTRIKHQFTNLQTCSMTTQFSHWIGDKNDMTVKDYMKYIFRVNQLFDVLGLKISIKDK